MIAEGHVERALLCSAEKSTEAVDVVGHDGTCDL